MRAGYSIAFLVAANLLPLFGVLLWDWDVFLLLLLFWFENVVIGLFGIARIVVSGAHRQFQGGVFLPLFFLVHYGGFMFGHFMVLFAFYSDNEQGSGVTVVPGDYLDIMLENLNWVALVALLISHGWSFAENFLGNREYDRMTVGEAMAMPYKRMVITHVALIVGGFFLINQGQPVVGLAILVLLKIVLDVVFHLREHRVLEA